MQLTTLLPPILVLEPTKLTPISEQPTAAEPVITTNEIETEIDNSGRSKMDHFMHFMYHMESPDHFLHWNYYFMVASCLGRRVWLEGDAQSGIFPNLYLVFVGNPGLGKSLPSNQCVDILKTLIGVKTTTNKKTGEIIHEDYTLVNICATATSLEGLWDAMGFAQEKIKISDNPLRYYIHCSVSFCLPEELGTLFRERTNDLVTFLTAAWNCRDFDYRTRNKDYINLINMCANLLGCCTPDWIARNMRSQLLQEGLLARILFIYGEKTRKRSVSLKINEDQHQSRAAIIKHLYNVARVQVGELTYTKEAWDWWTDFVNNKLDSMWMNQDKRCADFYGRYRHHLRKLAIVCHFGEKITTIIDVEDFEMALRELKTIEVSMHMALASTSNNPVYLLAINIKKSLADNKDGLSIKRILLLHFDEAEGGEEAIKNAISYLKDTGQAMDYVDPVDKIQKIRLVNND